MLISPDAFYISCLDRKSRQEIMKQLRSMKHEVNRFRKALKEDSTDDNEEWSWGIRNIHDGILKADIDISISGVCLAHHC